jgi:glycosyltransferase involved in cell wall biosynthesis
LNYPVSDQDLDRLKNYDNHYAFINYTSALVADWVVFNSRYHQRSFFERLHPFLGRFPDHQLGNSIGELQKKSSVIYPGFDAQQIKQNELVTENSIPVILWNHRWEYDKDPETFFNALFSLAEEGLKFNLVVLGQSFRQIPPIFNEARGKLSAHILHWGYVKDRMEYDHWLWKSDIAISTSNQDFFGISVVESIFANCYPLLPDRLAFPEHIPDHLKPGHLYTSYDDLLSKLRAVLTSWRPHGFENHLLKDHLQDYHYDKIAVEYKKLLAHMHTT